MKFSIIKFIWMLRKWLRKCYQTPKIVFRTIFHCTTKHPDFIFLTGIHFPLHSFYTQNSIYIEPNAPQVTLLIGLPFAFVAYIVFPSVVLPCKPERWFWRQSIEHFLFDVFRHWRRKSHVERILFACYHPNLGLQSQSG